MAHQVHTEEGQQHDTVPVDGKPHYVLGKDEAACDVVLRDASCSHLHAAVVHHGDGRLFLIDLASVRNPNPNPRPSPSTQIAPMLPLVIW